MLGIGGYLRLGRRDGRSVGSRRAGSLLLLLLLLLLLWLLLLLLLLRLP